MPGNRVVVRALGFGVLMTIAAAVGTTLTVASLAASAWTHPTRHPLTRHPEDYDLDYEDVRLTTEDGLHLAGWYIPSRNGAAVIAVHGIGGNRGDVLPVAQDLNRLGYGVLLFDLRAHGQSDGDTTSFGVREVRDVRAGLKYLDQRPEIDPNRLGIYGVSLGGSVAIMAAAELPELRVIVVDSTFSSLEWVVRHQFNQLENLPGWLAPLELAVGGFQAGVNPADVSPVSRVPRLGNRPLLILHGAADDTFLPENAELLYAAARGPRELYIMPGVGHGGLEGADPEGYAARIGAWFDRTLQPDRVAATESEP